MLLVMISLWVYVCFIVHVMDGPEFTRRWRAQEKLHHVRADRGVKRQWIVGMSANNDKSDIQVGVETRVFCLCFCFRKPHGRYASTIICVYMLQYLCMYLVTHNRAIWHW